jgi:hypothetical protein
LPPAFSKMRRGMWDGSHTTFSRGRLCVKEGAL